jgi:stage III sporulation protein AB
MASNMSDRVRRIGLCVAMLEEMASRLSHLRPTMLGLMTWLSSQKRFSELGFTDICAKKLSLGSSFSDSWKEAVLEKTSLIGRDEADILSSLGDILGKADVESGLAALKSSGELLRVRLEAARDEQRKKAGMFRSMGVLCGIAIAILII